VAYYVVEDRVYPCYVFEAMGEESQAKLDNDLGKIKTELQTTELQSAARAVDACGVIGAYAAPAPGSGSGGRCSGGIRSRDCRVHQEE
jgi:hypothetical protein